MALQSQVRRGNTGPRSSESYKRARRGEQKRLVGYLLLALLVVAGVMYVMQNRPRSAAAEPVSDQAGLTAKSRGSAEPERTAAPAPAASVYPPVVMEMGSRRTGGGGVGNVGGSGSGGTGGSEMLLASGAGGAGRAIPQAADRTTLKPTSMPPVAPPQATGAREAPAQQSNGQPAPAVRDPLIGGPGEGLGSTPPSNSELGLNQAAVPADLAGIMTEANKAITGQKPALARALLNRVVCDVRAPEEARAAARGKIEELNQTLVFSPAILAGDSLSATYSVASKDSLVRIARSQSLATEPNLIARVNNLANANSLNVGQKLKLVRGPFHAVVHKGEFRMDIFAGATPAAGSIGAGSASLADGIEPSWTYIRSFPVGLGEKGTTPIGIFTVKENSKLINPHWTNPRTGEKFDADDPKNPIGERWIGLEGLDAKSKAFTGYGVHGTIDPGSIGHEMSMGCVRMQAEDVEIVYDLLMPRVSVVKIVP